MRSLVFLLVLPIISCQHPGANKPIQKTRTLARAHQPDSIKESEVTEFIEYSKLTINGKINFDCRLSELYSVLGKPDSIVSAEAICVTAFSGNGDSTHYAYFNRSFAEVSRDSASISVVDLRDGKTRLVHPDFILDRTTTLESLKKYFPEAVKAASPIKTDIGDAIWINLQTDSIPSDFQWLLIFQKVSL